MSVTLEREGRLLVARISGPIHAEDVVALGQRLREDSAQQDERLVVLALFEQGIHLPDEAAKRAMRGQREQLREAVASVHVVLPGGFLASVGLLAGRLLSKLRATPRIVLHRSESAARSALARSD